MGRRLLPLLFLWTGCIWIGDAEYGGYWDGDEDGWLLGEDCADDHPDIYPFAPDRRGDGCDADCGRESDADGDDWPDDADCAPDDKDVYPCAEDDEGGEDLDCDGDPGPRTDACEGYDPDFPIPQVRFDACPFPAAPTP
jgi:hypothetical protein